MEVIALVALIIFLYWREEEVEKEEDPLSHSQSSTHTRE